MTFLKKLGIILAQGLSIVAGLGPILKLSVPNAAGTIDVVTNDLQLLSTIIVNVEAVGSVTGLTGEQKLKAALPMVEQAVLSSSMLVGHKIANETLFKKAVAEYAQASVDLLNSLHDNIETIGKT